MPYIETEIKVCLWFVEDERKIVKEKKRSKTVKKNSIYFPVYFENECTYFEHWLW